MSDFHFPMVRDVNQPHHVDGGTAVGEATLVVLAAGMGSRYGGIKQMDRVGPGGETLLEYSVFDAFAAGFSRAVFVIRGDIRDDFRSTILARLPGRIAYDLAFQELDSLIDPAVRSRAVGRKKPWGTAHAVLCSRPFLDGPFAVINADDFYGREAYAAMASFLSAGTGEGALVAYPISAVLSAAGTVSRGVCRTDGDFLAGVAERTAISLRDGRIECADGGGAAILDPETPASMNFWGFPASALDGIEEYFRDFLAGGAGNPGAESYLPAAVDRMISRGNLSVRVLRTGAEWFGMTYAADRAAAAARIAELTGTGRYPAPLWGTL